MDVRPRYGRRRSVRLDSEISDADRSCDTLEGADDSCENDDNCEKLDTCEICDTGRGLLEFNTGFNIGSLYCRGLMLVSFEVLILLYLLSLSG